MGTVSKRTWIIIFATMALALMAGAAAAVYSIARAGFHKPLDNVFGDQHLKTTVALVELHRIRFGSYPASLSELRFTGEWDAIALTSVSYCAAADRQSYYVTVVRGWVAKPSLTMPPEFWQGTGYRPESGPCK